MGELRDSIEVSDEINGTDTSYTFYLDLAEVTAIQVDANFDGTGTLDASVTMTLTNHPLAMQYKDNNAIEHKGLTVKWSSQSDVTFTAITTGAQDELINMGNLGSRYARIVVSRNSGTGKVALLVNRR